MMRRMATVLCVLGMAAAAAKAAPIMPDATKLAACYLFDEASGSTVLDSKGNAGNNGTMVGDSIARVATTPFNYAGNTAMSFNATGLADYVAIPVATNTLNFSKTTSFTISAWYKSPGAVLGSLVAKAPSSLQSYNVLIKGSSPAGGLSATVNSAGSGTPDAYYGDVWHNVVVSFTSNGTTGTGKIYVDGVERLASFNPGSSSTLAVDTLIGARRSTANTGDANFNKDSTAAFTGLMDDVAFFNYAVSADEAAWLGGNSLYALVTPEPATLCLLALGGVFMVRGRRHSR